MGLLAPDFTKPQAKAVSSSSTPSVTGDPAVDALLATYRSSIASYAATGRKSLLAQKKALKVQTKQSQAETAAYLEQLNALTVQPDPTVQGLSSPEVMQAQRQVSLDAAARKGMRKSIIAGSGAASPVSAPQSARTAIIPQV